MAAINGNANAKAFMAAYKLLGDVSAAAAAAKIHRSAHYQWLEKYPNYAKAFRQAREQLGDMLEAEIFKRAKDGTLEPVFYQGMKCGAVRRFDNHAGIAMLRALKPKEYGLKAEISGPGGAPIPTSITVTFVDPKPTED